MIVLMEMAMKAVIGQRDIVVYNTSKQQDIFHISSNARFRFECRHRMYKSQQSHMGI